MQADVVPLEPPLSCDDTPMSPIMSFMQLLVADDVAATHTSTSDRVDSLIPVSRPPSPAPLTLGPILTPDCSATVTHTTTRTPTRGPLISTRTQPALSNAPNAGPSTSPSSATRDPTLTPDRSAILTHAQTSTRTVTQAHVNDRIGVDDGFNDGAERNTQMYEPTQTCVPTHAQAAAATAPERAPPSAAAAGDVGRTDTAPGWLTTGADADMLDFATAAQGDCGPQCIVLSALFVPTFMSASPDEPHASFVVACRALVDTVVPHDMIMDMYRLLRTYYTCPYAQQGMMLTVKNAPVMQQYIMLLRQRIARHLHQHPHMLDHVDRIVPAVPYMRAHMNEHGTYVREQPAVPAHTETRDEHMAAVVRSCAFIDDIDMSAFAMSYGVTIRVVSARTGDDLAYYPMHVLSDARDHVHASAAALITVQPQRCWTFVHHGAHWTLRLPKRYLPHQAAHVQPALPPAGQLPLTAPVIAAAAVATPDKPSPTATTLAPTAVASTQAVLVSDSAFAAATPLQPISSTRLRTPPRDAAGSNTDVLSNGCLAINFDVNVEEHGVRVRMGSQSNYLSTLVRLLFAIAAKHNKHVSAVEPLPGLKSMRIRQTSLSMRGVPVQGTAAADTAAVDTASTGYTHTFSLRFHNAAQCSAASTTLLGLGLKPYAARPAYLVGKLRGIPYTTTNAALSAHLAQHAWRVGITPSLCITRIQQPPPAEHYADECYLSVLKSERQQLLLIPGMSGGRTLEWYQYSKRTPMMQSTSSTGSGVLCTHCYQLGHPRVRCPQSHVSNSEGGLRDACYKCSSFAHTVRNCSHINDTCAHCNKGTHSMRACPYLRGVYTRISTTPAVSTVAPSSSARKAAPSRTSTAAPTLQRTVWNTSGNALHAPAVTTAASTLFRASPPATTSTSGRVRLQKPNERVQLQQALDEIAALKLEVARLSAGSGSSPASVPAPAPATAGATVVPTAPAIAAAPAFADVDVMHRVLDMLVLMQRNQQQQEQRHQVLLEHLVRHAGMGTVHVTASQLQPQPATPSSRGARSPSPMRVRSRSRSHSRSPSPARQPAASAGRAAPAVPVAAVPPPVEAATTAPPLATSATVRTRPPTLAPTRVTDDDDEIGSVFSDTDAHSEQSRAQRLRSPPPPPLLVPIVQPSPTAPNASLAVTATTKRDRSRTRSAQPRSILRKRNSPPANTPAAKRGRAGARK